MRNTVVRSDIYTPAAWDIPPLRLPGHRFPVIVFSHGLGACRTTYTTFCLEFASRGFIVAALEHRDYSACMSYYFERQMSTEDKKTGELDSPPNLVKHWMLLKKVKSGKGEFSIRNQQAINPSKIWPALSLCANWLGIEDFFSGAVFVHSDNVACPFKVHQRAKECMAALDLLHALHKGEQVENIMDTSHLPLNSFNDIFDMDRISIAGHSFGGATVITTMAKDKRFK
ncbi:platelet-activating factor acetylhydrolase [Trichonephila clavipes]|uniref:1-alkyl-2-acetylglycerophosphocholine esterase n=1 Tax=Trichonephila clavipes TaxID=2585209 RepID=A0A8X6V526_TRICX|nr:platelet-activating factor acetylhydrolase [Trichonephila clavipes]